MIKSKVKKHITIDSNLNARLKDICKDLDISEAAYIRLSILADLEKRNY